MSCWNIEEEGQVAVNMEGHVKRRREVKVERSEPMERSDQQLSVRNYEERAAECFKEPSMWNSI